jgi:hypothetical protein
MGATSLPNSGPFGFIAGSLAREARFIGSRLSTPGFPGNGGDQD